MLQLRPCDRSVLAGLAPEKSFLVVVTTAIQIQPSTAQSASLEQQAQCASQAEKIFSQRGFDHASSALQNHLNRKLNKCFMSVRSRESNAIKKDLMDAFEQRFYAHYVFFSDSDDPEEFFRKP